MSRCGGRVRLFLSPVWRAKTKEDAAASPELNCTSRPLAVEGWVIAWRVLERRPRLCADLCRIRRACDAPGTALFVLFGLGKPVPPAKPAARRGPRVGVDRPSLALADNFLHNILNMDSMLYEVLEQSCATVHFFYHQSKVPSYKCA